MFIWNVEKCLKIFSRVYVSSDDDWILSEAENIGAIPIKRGEELCGDVPNIPVYQHALTFMNGVDGIIAVQANSPTIKSKLIMEAKRYMEIGVQEVLTFHPDGTKYGSIWGLSTKRLKEYEEKELYSFLVKHGFLFQFLELHGTDIKTVLENNTFENGFKLIFSKRINMTPEIKNQYEKIANLWKLKFKYGHS